MSEADSARKKFYITTAIAYPNGKPHMGHALEIIQADCLARFYRLLGKDVWFQTGTDEHGIKNWRTAKQEGKDIMDFLDANVAVFIDLYKKLNISNDYFIRTSDKKLHYPGSQKLWKKLIEAGDLYKKKYTGLYCVGCESFKTEKELVDGKCPDHPTRVIEEVEEENYFFKLSKYKDQIIKIIESDEYKVVPQTRKNEILSFLKDAKDISFSRNKEALPWGIPIPEDDAHVMYVWCDALSNYITGPGYAGLDDEQKNQFKNTWPCDIHCIGKDILRFHAAFWPAMLLSAGVQLPKELFVHGFLHMSGAKMGKSTGNVVDPFKNMEEFGVDPFRYFILSCMPIDGDGDYSEDLIIERINSEVVGNISNFCYRSLSFTNKTLNDSVAEFDKSNPIIKQIEDLFIQTKAAYEKRDFKQVISTILEISSIGNRFMQENEPWKNKETAPQTMSLCLNIVKNLAILLHPIMPAYAEEIQKQLNLPLEKLSWDNLNFELTNHKIGKGEIIIRKVEKKEVLKYPANLKVAEIKEAKLHDDSDKLIVLQIDIGEDNPRQLVAGLQKYYKPEDLVGKKIIVVSNLKPAKLGGKLSQGMLLAASSPDDKEVILIEVDGKPGGQVNCGSLESDTSELKIDNFFNIPLKIKDKKILVEKFGSNLILNGKEITVDVADGYTVG
ncbi:methionine--tRNA ligase [Candidatus Woesearchaeota archaeon]|nr:methionine--tRNA ligase [Candidatus Woesearchaeota archaeon]